jgi:mono/diheme cytochrome c family protein
MSLIGLRPVLVACAMTLFLLCGQAAAEQKAAASTGKIVYERDCATCHGPEGKGDGETATYLTPQPQDFTTGLIQKRSDEFLTAVITKGGSAKGLSESMPGFPKLSKSDVQSVVAYVRQLGKSGAKKTK